MDFLILHQTDPINYLSLEKKHDERPELPTSCNVTDFPASIAAVLGKLNLKYVFETAEFQLLAFFTF